MPKTESDGVRRVVYQLPWWKKAWHDYQDRRAQKQFTQRHRKEERSGGFRLTHLGDGHLLGFRPWCDTELRPCPDFPWRRCCQCSHQDANRGA